MNLKENYIHFMQHPPQRIVWQATAVLFLLSFAFIFFWWNRLPPLLPLFYSLAWGKDQLGSPLMLLGCISVALLLFVINTICAILLVDVIPFFSRILFFGGVGISLLVFITITRIIMLIG